MIDSNIYKNYSDCIVDLKYTSKDKTNDEFMVHSNLRVYNFDKVVKNYCKIFHPSGVPKSNDSLYYFDEDKIFFIEFKNGNLYKEVYDLHIKLLESLLIFLDIEQENLDFARKNIQYILVYNSKKSSIAKIGQVFKDYAKENYIELGLNKYVNIYLKDIFTYDSDEFKEKFIKKYDNT